MIQNILMLDPPAGNLGTLAQAFREVVGGDCVIHTVSTSGELLASLRAAFPYHLVVVDLQVGNGQRSGLEILRQVRAFDHGLPLIAVAEQGNVQVAAQAVAAGATDFLVRGPNLQDRVTTLLGKVRQLVRLIERKQVLEHETSRLQEAERVRYQIIGDSPQMRELLERTRRVAPLPRPVLVVGERGTGKELVARAIHDAGGDPARTIVAVNCAAFSDSLLESELFGHEKGAFTGADRAIKGKFELADGGTLFLDEIGCMSLAFQQKILRTVEYGVVIRVGGTQDIRTSARIVAATNADLEQKMAAGEFLRDLYDRLAFEVILVPPLRERTGDIEILANHFLASFMREVPSMRGKRMSASAVRALKRYRFPGNVRELKTIIERAAYRDTTNEITVEDLGLPLGAEARQLPGGFEEKVQRFKQTLISDAMAEAGGNQAQAARLLGLSYHQLRYYLRKLVPDAG